MKACIFQNNSAFSEGGVLELISGFEAGRTSRPQRRIVSNCLGQFLPQSRFCPFTDVHEDPKLPSVLPAKRTCVSVIEKGVCPASRSLGSPASADFHESQDFHSPWSFLGQTLAALPGTAHRWVDPRLAPCPEALPSLPSRCPLAWTL